MVKERLIRLFFLANAGAYAAARFSLSSPRITILSVLSGNGRCNALASSHGARIQTSRSSSVVRIRPSHGSTRRHVR